MARLRPPNDGDVSDSDASDGDFEDAQTSPSKRQRLRRLGGTIKDAPKRALLRLDLLDDRDGPMDADGVEIEGITDNPAFNTGEILRKKKRDSRRNFATRAIDSVQVAARVVAHPKQAAKVNAATELEPTQSSFLTTEDDKQLLEAHEDLAHASQDSSTWASADEALDRLKGVETQRTSMRNAWVTSRHVKRARVVPRGDVPFPRSADYRQRNENGVYVRFQWERYLGHMLLYLSDDFGPMYTDVTEVVSFKRDTLLRHAERLMLATTPWQTWLLHVRRVYMWEDWLLSGRWLATYLVLMKTGYIMTFLYLYIIVIVVRNRFYPTSTAELRLSHQRILNQDSRLHNITELIKRHGNEDWLDALLEELGPLLQQQLGDLADYLEILINFYNWSNPRATRNTVIFWSSCALVAACTSTQFGVKIVWWVVGLYFFFSRTIAVHYPQYRHVVSVPRWIYWGIPTHAELAFMQLQEEAEKHRKVEENQGARESATAKEGVASEQPVPTFVIDEVEEDGQGRQVTRRSSESSEESPSVQESPSSSVSSSQKPEEQPRLSFRGRHEGQAGRLIVHWDEIRFEADGAVRRSLRGSPFQTSRVKNAQNLVLFSHAYSGMRELRKCKTIVNTLGSRIKKGMMVTPQEALHITLQDGSAVRVEGMGKRDEAFNTIIGFSGLRWQVLQPLEQKEDGTFDTGEVGTDEMGRRVRSKSGRTVFEELGRM